MGVRLYLLLLKVKEKRLLTLNSSIRGAGLAYGVYLQENFDAGTVCFDVYRSLDVFKTYEAGKAVIEKYVNGEVNFSPLHFYFEYIN